MKMNLFTRATIVVGVFGALLIVCLDCAKLKGNNGKGFKFKKEYDAGVTESAINASVDIYTCCAMTFGACKEACENFPLALLDNHNRNTKLLEIKKYCPLVKVDFWACLNETVDAVSRGSQWLGHTCCSQGLLPKCQNACATSTSRKTLLPACRVSDEVRLYACLERQEAVDECCSNARTNECFQLCRDILEKRSSLNSQYYSTDVEVVCNSESGNSEALECIRKYADLTPVTNAKKFLPCCERTKVEKCRVHCRNVLHLPDVTEEMIGNTLVQADCGSPSPIDPFWQCFLLPQDNAYYGAGTNEVSQISQIGIDSAKLHCCHQAFAPKCRRLCQQTFFNNWTITRSEFENDCLMQITELDMRHCMDEVEEPCELGCDGLSFCTNFNNRPTELFRNCFFGADQAAKADMTLWRQMGTLKLPSFNLPLRNISKCSPERWQAVACVMQIEPCTRDRHRNVICREDCYEILSECLDWTRLEEGLTYDAICSKFSSDYEDGCVSLKPFIDPSDVPLDTGGHHGLTSPCKGHPCNVTEVCQPFRNQTVGFSCVPGCSLGEASNYWVPYGAHVRIPTSSAQPDCLKICQCGHAGRIENCQPVPCFAYSQCVIGDRRIPHASWFYIECNICSCFAGEITCTKKQCRIPGLMNLGYTSLPCNCPAHYVPVCGSNGYTYQSSCLAKCAGLHDTEIEFGACEQEDSCKEGSYDCPLGTICLPDRQVCLSVMHRPCKQYRCVPSTVTCNISEPVCDRNGLTHPSPCQLLASGAKFSSFGSCFKDCSHQGPICGINGVTYKNECDAWSDYSLKDYSGPCREVGLLIADDGVRCKNIQCEPLPSKYCQRIVPPGACCPICSGAIQIIYSRKQVDRALYSLKGKDLHKVTLKGILHELDNLIQITQCKLSGFLSMETDIFVVVQSNEKFPTQIQIEACTREAEKIATLISTRSHKITTNLALSSLTVALKITENVDSGANFPRWTVMEFSSIATICWIIILWCNAGWIS